ncbi:DUF481 domain-containing protein [Planctobacterium marinum]|uniref:DUF481 domain-containing protein n=1 Tax=Planctobacterium marinum TaxID=1631968 RepID=A0AA48KR74_9ALTE|nr:hypothetical protein MACH26_13430 [Planctobacterium marinum]
MKITNFAFTIFLSVLSGSVGASGSVSEEEQKDFTLEGEFGSIFSGGNTQTTSFKGSLRSHHEMQDWSNDYVIEALYRQDDVMLVDDATGEEYEETQTTAQRFFISSQANYKLTDPDNRLFAFASYEDARFSSFEYQATIAAGWSSQWFKKPNSHFTYSIGPGYAFQELQEGEDASGMILRGQLDYGWKISKNANIKQILSTEIGSLNTKSRSESSVSAKINGSMSMKVSVILNHNTEVEEGAENLDTETAVTLVYNFF